MGQVYTDLEPKRGQGKQLVLFKDIPFVDEVEEFNDLMNKPNNYEPIIPERKEWEFVYNFVLEELEEYREACERGDIVEVLDALCDITYVSLGMELCYMVLRIKFGQPIKRCKPQTYQRLALLKLKQKKQWSLELGNKGKHATMKSVVINILYTDRVIRRL